MAIEQERALVNRYEALIQNAEDDQSRQILDTILMQTRMHYMMFTHVLRRGPGAGFGVGPGMDQQYMGPVEERMEEPTAE